ncbi:hypothetical protein NQ317_013396 [Molorchus minor]|uniref:Uncharacterized protein n=1 Tax=Molorchus minor TaxID=1323400 RepID=A0ABQ9J6V1_9CUCU|nr:hypothetical protein NQ317_013396 [Molorchus minor]
MYQHLHNIVICGDMANNNDGYETGKSTFFVVLKSPSPLPVTQRVDTSIPLPKTRHVLFNKPESSSHQKSHSMRSTGSNSSHLEDLQLMENGNMNDKISITFRELHDSYGKPILKDFSLWKCDQRDKTTKTENIITF